MAKLYRSDGRVDQLGDYSNVELETLQKHVGGDVEYFFLEDGSAMAVNENGKRENLPVNRRATAIAARVLAPTDYLVGDVVLMTPEEALAQHEVEID